MATLIYLPSSGGAAVTPSTWIFANQINPLTFAGSLTRGATALTTKLEATGTTNPTTRAMLRYVIGPLASQTISGTVRMIMSCMESNANANANLAMAVKIIQSNGADRATLLAVTSSDSASAPYELTVSPLKTKIVYTSAEVEPLTLTTQNATQGDYLVIEIGFRSATSTSRNISLRYGNDAASDFEYTVGLTTDLNPWVEFSANLTWYDPNKYLYAATGTFTEAGKDSFLLKHYAILGTAGAFSLSGKDAILTYAPVTNRFLYTDKGVFTESGKSAYLLQNKNVYATKGTFTDTSSNALLFHNYWAWCAKGDFVLSGKIANLLYPKSVWVEEGLFVLTGSNATLDYTKVDKYLYAATGVFSEAGKNALLFHNIAILSSKGQFVESGKNALIFHNYWLLSAKGLFALSGKDAILIYGILPIQYHLYTNKGIFLETGGGSIAINNRAILTAKGVFIELGKDAKLGYSGSLTDFYLFGGKGGFALTLCQALLISSAVIIPPPTPVGQGGFYPGSEEVTVIKVHGAPHIGVGSNPRIRVHGRPSVRLDIYRRRK